MQTFFHSGYTDCSCSAGDQLRPSPRPASRPMPSGDWWCPLNCYEKAEYSEQAGGGGGGD